jgi:transcription-repair coupling factor (superfamily II helicase)
VDTLTLTATPIPRTLHFSLMGARDLSVINTPPPNRQPVRTELHVFNQEIIQDAVAEEVRRGGQVFFIHNRVKDIYDYAAMIERLVPGTRAAVAHGQMEGHQLEDIMLKFVEGDYDVLVATTIIESGLDIPNANTIIINNAHMHGLSDLHQMRGRVGRSNKKAYCYLFSPPLSTLTQEARKRLNAIEQFSDLGSGFNVAMRDLDIRGAGNLLGGEQSGFIAEIGFEMYHKILDEALQELKDEEFKDLFKDETPKPRTNEVQVDVDSEILIPDHYVRNIQERLSLYNELAQIDNEDKLLKFRDELIDRFGLMPKELKGLFDSMRMKWKARDLGFERINLNNKTLTCYFPANQGSSYYQSELFGNILKYVTVHPVKCSMKQTPKNLTMILKNVTGVLDAIRELDELKGSVM